MSAPAVLANAAELRPVPLDRHSSENGVVSVAEFGRHVPFVVKRAFFVTGVAAGSVRGRHAHKTCNQFLICTAGSVEILIDDGRERRAVMLASLEHGLHVPPGIWCAQKYVTAGSVLAVLCDAPYIEEEYVRDHEDFLRWRKEAS